MQKTFTNFSRAKQSNQNSDIQMYGLFKKDTILAAKKEKQVLLQRLRKGTLFRLTHNSKPQPKPFSKDPFVHWLQENSSYDLEEQICGRTMGETYFYMNSQEIEKQKKLPKSILPALNKFKSKHFDCKSAFSTATNPNRSFNASPTLSKANKFNNERTSPFRSINPISSDKPRLKPIKTHKQNCYQINLSRTQVFPSQLNKSFYQNKENLIQSQFYLNDHKKKSGFQTFYINQKTKILPDKDLSRVEGLKNKFVHNFEDNLKKIQKQTSLSCYDEVSKYFMSMKSEIRQVINDKQETRKQRKTHNDRGSVNRDTIIDSNEFSQKRRVQVEKVNNLNQSNQSKQVNQQNKSNHIRNSNEGQKSMNEGYLPQFLLKSITLPIKRQSQEGQQQKKARLQPQD